MNHFKNDSELSAKMVESGREITRLFREAITADRRNRSFAAKGGSNIAWTKAAKARDDAVRILKERMHQIAKDI